MILLKHVIHQSDNSVEATWVDEIRPAVEVPESTASATKDWSGKIIPGKVTPAHTIPAVEVQVRCHSYADVQMQMFREHAQEMGTPLTEHEALIALVEAGIVPYIAPVPTVLACLVQIDNDTDAIYGAVLGNRAEEYTLAANEAQAYKAAGYTGSVPSSVQSWATAKSWTATQSADDILLTAAKWTSAQSAIRAQRLLHKEQVRTAVGDPARAAVMAAWAGFVSYMRGQLGL